MPTPFTPERRPLEVDVYDQEATTEWILRKVSEQVITKCQPRPAIHLLFDDHEEIIDWTAVHAVDPGADLAATWAEVAARPGLERRFLVLALSTPDHTLAGVLEQVWEDGGPSGWMLAYTAYKAVDGVGHLNPNWRVDSGEGAPPGQFGSMFTPAPGARAVALLPAKRPEPEVWFSTAEILEGIPAPTSPMEVTAAVSDIVLNALETEGIKHLIVMLLRGRTWERWLLGPDQPAAADDMVRWMCSQGSPPDAVATVEAALVPVDGKPERVIRVMAEMGGCRTERINIMLPKPGKPMDVIPGRWMARELGQVKDGEGWIGVAPLLAGELEVRVIGEGRPR